MIVPYKQLIEDKIMKNLLSAHSRLVYLDSPFKTIVLTRFILRLANKRKDLMVDPQMFDPPKRGE